MTAAPDAPTFEGLLRAHPEWRAWLDVMRAALDQAADPGWRQAVVTPAPTREPGAPWLSGASIAVDEGVARRWLEALLDRAADAPAGRAQAGRRPPRSTALDHAVFLRAAIELDQETLERAGRVVGLAADRARALAHPAALPLLAACAARSPAVPAGGWDHGYCPVCGAWPALAELRGLEASRQLRCARCGADWATAWLACIFCGNDDHRELGGLVSDAAGPLRRVDTCQRCRGYVKSVTTLTARTHAEVVLEDVATVAYDVRAIEDGASRPAGPGWPLRVTVELTRRKSGLLGRWR